jgi:predicted SprT family Zn-dependent metalloprotease
MNIVEQVKQNRLETCVIVQENWDKLVSKFNPHSHVPPEVTFFNSHSGVAGLAYRTGLEISFNASFLLTMPIEEFKETILHELCHIIQFRCFPHAKQAHGTEFRMIMNCLGYSGSTYHRYDMVKQKQVSKGNRVVLSIL